MIATDWAQNEETGTRFLCNNRFFEDYNWQFGEYGTGGGALLLFPPLG